MYISLVNKSIVAEASKVVELIPVKLTLIILSAEEFSVDEAVKELFTSFLIIPNSLIEEEAARELAPLVVKEGTDCKLLKLTKLEDGLTFTEPTEFRLAEEIKVELTLTFLNPTERIVLVELKLAVTKTFITDAEESVLEETKEEATPLVTLSAVFNVPKDVKEELALLVILPVEVKVLAATKDACPFKTDVTFAEAISVLEESKDALPCTLLKATDSLLLVELKLAVAKVFSVATEEKELEATKEELPCKAASATAPVSAKGADASGLKPSMYYSYGLVGQVTLVGNPA